MHTVVCCTIKFFVNPNFWSAKLFTFVGWPGILEEEMVVSKNQPLVEFQAKLTERYKGLLQVTPMVDVSRVLECGYFGRDFWNRGAA